MEEKGIISQSFSIWNSSIVLVQKKNKDYRLCLDFRKLNQVTKQNLFPLPRIEDFIYTMSWSTWFTTLDQKAGYWQVPIYKEHREKTAFNANNAHFEFNYFPFGLANAPATFQRMMTKTLKKG